jgi:uncharacterized membrane protein
MFKNLFTRIKPLFKPLLALCLAVMLVFGQAQGALAASGGRIGGGSFRAPSSGYRAPSPSYRSPSGGYGGGYGGGYYPGGGYGFPFFVPIFSIGGGFGGLFTILIFISIAGFLVNTVRRSQSDSLGYDSYGESVNPTLSVARLQVGLLSSARSLQTDLNRIAASANTGSSAGLTKVLQETTLALLRHPEYWVYAGSETQKARLEAAELQFNRLALAERSKFSEESLSNVNNQLMQAPTVIDALPAGESELSPMELKQIGEYIVVTLLVATQGQLQLPQVNSSDDLRQALSQLGSVSSDRLLALEVLWTPQAEGDTLSSEDVVSAYPNLKLV